MVARISVKSGSSSRRRSSGRNKAVAGACFSLGLGLVLSTAKASALTFTNYTTTNGLGSNNVNGVYADSGSIYAATDREALIKAAN
jgi:cytochrome c biogenesis protein CcdA